MRAIVARFALSTALLGTPALAAAAQEKTPIRLVPARDHALAALALAGEGLRRPVILFDPADPEAFDHYAKGRKRTTECVQRERTPEALRALLREAAGGDCANVDLIGFARSLWPQARAAIVVTAADYPWLLRAAAFAAATDTALIVVDEAPDLAASGIGDWKLDALYLTPPMLGAAEPARGLAGRVAPLADAGALTAELMRLRAADPPRAVVVANPNDRLGVFSPSSLSLLAPLVAARHRAPLFLTDTADPAAIETEVLRWIDANRLAPTHVVLVGDELALGSHRVPDPVLAGGGREALGGGTEVRVELFSEIQRDRPQDYAVGRIVGEDVARASATLARLLHDRQSLSKKALRDKPVIFLSNADEVFALGEAISRTTANELRNVDVPVRAYYRGEITPERVRKSLEGTEMLVWEGHARDLTLEERGGIAADSAPAYVVLQGCYTLDRSDPFILMERGTQAIVATSAAIYSASGSGFARALFDRLLYENADLGTAVRDARNYLLAVTELKRQRGHADWTKTYRAALAFALWGDPTDRPPLAGKRPDVDPVRWARDGNALGLTIPAGLLPEAKSGRYVARPPPRAMLSGLILREDGTTARRVKDLFFTVQPEADGRVRPCAPSTGWNVVSLYAPRTRSLTVLARPDWDQVDSRDDHGRFVFPLAHDASECPPPAAVTPPRDGRRSVEQPGD